ncbi:MAG: hypothetical protein ACTSX8_05840 [Alphaproteobacteria bacterium]
MEHIMNHLSRMGYRSVQIDSLQIARDIEETCHLCGAELTMAVTFDANWQNPGACAGTFGLRCICTDRVACEKTLNFHERERRNAEVERLTEVQNVCKWPDSEDV